MADKGILEVIKEDGINDLPMAVRGLLAKGLIIEREVGEDTPESLEYLDKAVEKDEALKVKV